MKDNKIKNIFKGIGYTILLFLLYALIPSFIAGFLVGFFRIDETVATFIGDVIFILGVVFYYRKLFISSFKDYKDNFKKYIKVSLKYWGIGLAIMMISNLILNIYVFNGNIANNEEVNRTFMESYKLIGFIQIGFLAPIIEELIFRYGIRKITNHKVIYPLLSALVFGLPHALTGITTPLELLYVIPYGALGYMFASLYNKTDNILTNISMHMLHNLMVYTLLMIGM